MNRQDKIHKRRVRDWLGTALCWKSKGYFSKTTKIGKERRQSLADTYRKSRATGKSLDQLRREAC